MIAYRTKTTEEEGKPAEDVSAPQQGGGDKSPKQGLTNNDDVEQLQGTVYFGGAGLDGDYIDDMIAALIEVGINAKAVDKGRLSGGAHADAILGTLVLRDQMEADNFPSELRLPTGDKEQFNLIGYSFGSLLAAQFAAKYADQGMIIDNLVLVGSPISAKFLKKLQNHQNISNVIVIDLTKHNDPIRAGMTLSSAVRAIPTLMQQDVKRNGSGHFYYRCTNCGDLGKQRRRDLAQELYDAGLR